MIGRETIGFKNMSDDAKATTQKKLHFYLVSKFFDRSNNVRMREKI